MPTLRKETPLASHGSRMEDDRTSTASRSSAVYRVSRQSGLSGFRDVVKTEDGRHSTTRSSAIKTASSMQDMEGELFVDHMLEVQNGWFVTALLLLVDVFGTGVLSIANAIRVLGWVPGMAILSITMPLNVYTGVLLSRLQQAHPIAITVGDMFGLVFGPKSAIIGYTVLYLYILVILADDIIVLSQSVQGVFYWVDMCQPMVEIRVNYRHMA